MNLVNVYGNTVVCNNKEKDTVTKFFKEVDKVIAINKRNRRCKHCGRLYR